MLASNWFNICHVCNLENLVDGFCGCLVGWFGDFNAGLDGLSVYRMVGWKVGWLVD